ncbi:MAG: hypothetical protein ABI663_03225 [Chryseolinea sp.]
MNLNNLKPAWRQLRVLNSMQGMNQEEILLILEGTEIMAISKTNRLLMLTIVFMVITFFCQGG